MKGRGGGKGEDGRAREGKGEKETREVSTGERGEGRGRRFGSLHHVGCFAFEQDELCITRPVIYIPWGPIGLNTAALQAAGDFYHLSSPDECAAYARILQGRACAHQCGPEACTGACAIGCFLYSAGITSFYFGSRGDVIRALTTEYDDIIHIVDEVRYHSVLAGFRGLPPADPKSRHATHQQR